MLNIILIKNNKSLGMPELNYEGVMRLVGQKAKGGPQKTNKSARHMHACLFSFSRLDICILITFLHS